MFVRGYGHFLKTAASLQWSEAVVDLRPDADAWRSLPAELRRRLGRLVAGFCVGEERVATEPEPFAAAANDESVAACFRAQAVDETRHARFFDRVLGEVIRAPGADAAERRRWAGGRVEPAFLELFDERLPRAAAELARGQASLSGAVALYHLLLEGIVFSAGQLAVLELLQDRDDLPGLRRGTELVLRDERWHIGFGACLLHRRAGAGRVNSVLAEAAAVLATWGDAVPEPIGHSVLALHARRVSAARLQPLEVAS